jgi:hypothetical protein
MTTTNRKKQKMVITRRPFLVRFGLSTHSPRLLLPIVPLIFVLVLDAGRAAMAVPTAEQDKKEKPYALLFGTIWGPDNHPVYGVPVKIRRANEKKARWELYSDHHGEFAQRFPAGKSDYVVWVDLKGIKFNDGKQLAAGEEAKVHFEFDERVDVSLHLK